MRNILKLSTLSFLLLFLVGCDPSRNIEFINRTESPIKIKIKVGTNNTSESLKEASVGDSIVFKIAPNGTQNLYCGMGTWSENEVNEKAKCIENIEIETKDIKTIYKSTNSITKILKDNRKGLWWKTKIEIEVE
jgi:hypothetical protein